MRRCFLVRPFLVGVACSGVLLTAACGSSDGTATPETTTRAEVTAAPSATPSAGQTPSQVPASTATPVGTVITIVYAGGEATGDTGRTKVKVGEPITLKVTSDVKNEVHIHGADLYLDLEPGVEAVQDFTQDAPGVYEVELHEGSGVLTRIQAE